MCCAGARAGAGEAATALTVAFFFLPCHLLSNIAFAWSGWYCHLKVWMSKEKFQFISLNRYLVGRLLKNYCTFCLPFNLIVLLEVCARVVT